jgi:hypothetical protein
MSKTIKQTTTRNDNNTGGFEMEACMNILNIEPIKVDFVTVTPEQAQVWLDSRAPNRNIRDLSVSRFAQDMVDGTWVLSHQGLAFDRKERLVDGQNRLAAVVRSGVEVPMIKFTYLDDILLAKALLVMDSGAKRSPTDNAIISGKLPENTSGKAWGIAKQMVDGGCSTRSLRTTHARMAEFIIEHMDAINFCLSNIRTHAAGVSQAVVRAAIARAYYHCDHERLVEFCQVLTTGVSTSKDDVAAALLYKFLSAKQAPNQSHGLRKHEAYSKAENAIKKFCDRTYITQLKAIDSEIFPIEASEMSVQPKQ